MSKKRPLVFTKPVAVETVDEVVVELLVVVVVLLVVLIVLLVVLIVLLVVLIVLLVVLLVLALTTDLEVEVGAAVAVPGRFSDKLILILCRVSCLGHIDNRTDYMKCMRIQRHS